MSIFNPFHNLGEISNQSDDFYINVVPEELNNQKIKREKTNRSFWVFNIFCVAAGLILFLRLLDLQIIEGFQNQYLAQGNRVSSRLVSAPRGLIYDAKGSVLVQNIADFEAQLKIADLPKKKEDRLQIITKISEIFNYPLEDLQSQTSGKTIPSEPIILKEEIIHDEALALEIKIVDLPAVSIVAKSKRKYLTDGALSHLLGYTGKINKEEHEKNPGYSVNDDFGKTGLEKIYELFMTGKKGVEKIEVDSARRYQRTLSFVEPKPGNNLILNLDYDLQKEATRILVEKTKQVNDEKAIAIAMNPQTGAIYTMVSLPAYDNNLFASGISNEEYAKIKENKNLPMLNRSVSGLYPPGSVLKPMVAAAALNENIISESDTINDTGEIRIGDWIFPDWKAHGLVDVKKAISESCDVFFYAISGGWEKIKGLGLNKLNTYMSAFGFGEKTGIDLPGESSGLLPDEEWKKTQLNEPWYIGDTYHSSIGQGYFLSTPLQIITAISAIANGGKLYTPQLVDKITDSKGNIIDNIEPNLIRDNFVDSKSIEITKEGMRQAVLEGTARQLNDLPFTSAGKTGTAQFGDKTKEHSWFVSFAPYENPEIALVIMVEGGGEGYDVAEPAAKEILQYYFNNKQK